MIKLVCSVVVLILCLLFLSDIISYFKNELRPKNDWITVRDCDLSHNYFYIEYIPVICSLIIPIALSAYLLVDGIKALLISAV